MMGTGSPLLLSEWSPEIYPMPYKQNVLRVLNKMFPTFPCMYNPLADSVYALFSFHLLQVYICLGSP